MQPRDEDPEFTRFFETPGADGSCAQDAVGAFGALRRVGRAAGRAGRGIGRTAARAGRGGARLAVSTSLAPAKLTARGLAIATGPIRRRIFRAFFGKLMERRARFLSWQARRSLRPDARERAEARVWALSWVRRRGPFGRLVSAALSGDAVGEPVTTALVTASIPVLLKLAQQALRAAERQGAPADPREQNDADADEDVEG